MARPSALAIVLLLGVPVKPALSPSVTRHVAPTLAAPSLAPGVGRCTSDGVCTVTDAAGTREGTPLTLAP